MLSFPPRHGSYAGPLALLAAFAPSLFFNTASAAVTVSAPSGNPTSNVVSSNFLGLSVELSFVNYYFGNTTAQTPEPVVRYLSELRARSGGQPMRVRLGGNSMDSSTYMPNQQDILVFTDPTANINDQPVDFGPQLFDVMKGMSDSIGGAEYLIGLSLRQPNNTNIPLLAGAAAKALGDTLDAYLVGNEPDLYSKHGQRPNIANYTTDDYIADYATVFSGLQSTPDDGNVLTMDNIGGPTICCFWDLASLLQSGWLDKYSTQLKYITLQHYPQDTCSGHPSYGVEHYIVHSNTVGLAQWQRHGLDLAAAANKPVIMDEFNSISCGGTDGISNTFGVALWTADYALQMAAVGYAAAYLHTREPGVTYNPFDAPHVPAGGAGPWTTNPPYYAMLPVAEALQSDDGSRVVDLNINGSMSDGAATAAGYAIYSGKANTVHSFVLFNYANVSGATSDYALDAEFFKDASDSTVTVRYLTADSVNEQTNIAYGAQTYAGVGDANAVQATFAASMPDKNVSCSSGCTVQVPGPGLAVVFVGGAPATPSLASSGDNGANSTVASKNSTSGGDNGSSHTGGGERVLARTTIAGIAMVVTLAVLAAI